MTARCLKALSIFFLCLNCVVLHADRIRGLIVEDRILEGQADLLFDMELRADEMAVIRLAGETRFLDGVLVEVLLSDVLKKHSEGFALTVYSDIETSPSLGMGDYKGREVYFAVLPFASRIRLGIPIDVPAGDSFQALEELTDSTEAVSVAGFPLLLAVQSISKGLPVAALTRNFFFTVQPVLANRGLLDVSLMKPKGFEDAEVALLLDELSLEEYGETFELDSGVHSLQVVSEVFKPQTATFTIRPGQQFLLEVALEPAVSFVTVESLEGAAVYLDGEKLSLSEGQRKELTEGEHTIRFKLGRYSVTKKFTVEAGMNYTIALGLDIQVRQEM